MRVLCCVSVVLTLAIGSVRAQRLPNRQQVAEDVDLAVRTELGKILSVVEYDRDIGKIARIHYYCAKAANLEDARRIYVSVKSDVVSRRAAIQMQESIIKSIVRGTRHKPVGAIENADAILEVDFQAAGSAGW
jgi:hypothetical protein